MACLGRSAGRAGRGILSLFPTALRWTGSHVRLCGAAADGQEVPSPVGQLQKLRMGRRPLPHRNSSPSPPWPPWAGAALVTACVAGVAATADVAVATPAAQAMPTATVTANTRGMRETAFLERGVVFM